MKSNPLISIIIPVYNTEQYLEKCLNSVLNQTYRNLEILIIDDGSTDDSFLILQKFQSIDSRITVFQQKNGGLSSARNTGLKNASGSHIGFVDSDDWVEENMYEILLNLIIKHNAEISECSIYNTADKLKEQNKIQIEKTSAYNWVSNLIVKTSLFGVPYKLFRKDVIENVFFKDGKMYEDSLFIYDIYSNINFVVSTNQQLYNYYCNPNSLTKSDFNIKRLDLLYAIEYLIIFLINNNFDKNMIDVVKFNTVHSCFSLYNSLIISNISYDISYLKYIKSIEKKYIRNQHPTKYWIQFLLPYQLYRPSLLFFKQII